MTGVCSSVGSATETTAGVCNIRDGYVWITSEYTENDRIPVMCIYNMNSYDSMFCFVGLTLYDEYGSVSSTTRSLLPSDRPNKITSCS